MTRPILLFFFANALAVSASAWEMRRSSLMSERDRPPVENGVVSIEVSAEPHWFPRYLNEVGVETIRLAFDEPGAGPRRLSLVWTGGSEGSDGFRLDLDGHRLGATRVVDSARHRSMWWRDDFDLSLASPGRHTLEITSSPEAKSALEFSGIRLASPVAPPYQPLCYDSIGTLASYEASLHAPGVMIDQPHLTVFAPRTHERAAQSLAPFLERAYGVMRSIYGRDTVFKFAVELYPPGHERGWGGISGQATIGYSTEALERFARLGANDVRGFAGFTEEMSHGFKAIYHCDGTYEALGVAVQEDIVRRLVPPQVADGFWLTEHQTWAETHRAYLAAGKRNPDPNRYPWNILYTRILNDVFLTMRTEYGANFWPDFFALLRQRDYPLHGASRTALMGVYADLFTQLMHRDMRVQFTAWGITLDCDPPWGWETNHPPS